MSPGSSVDGLLAVGLPADRAQQHAAGAELDHLAAVAQQRRRVAGRRHGDARAVDERAHERDRRQPRLLDEDVVDQREHGAGAGVEARRRCAPSGGRARSAPRPRCPCPSRRPGTRGGGRRRPGRCRRSRRRRRRPARPPGRRRRRSSRAARAAGPAAGWPAACARRGPAPRTGARSGRPRRRAARGPGRRRSRPSSNVRPLSALTNVIAPRVSTPQPHRHDHHRAHPDRPHRLQLLRVLDRLLEQLVRDLAEQLRRAAAQHAGDAGVGVEVGRVAAAQVLGHRHLRGVAVGERDLADAAVGRPGRSTAHQSASQGTASSATRRSVS